MSSHCDLIVPWSWEKLLCYFYAIWCPSFSLLDVRSEIINDSKLWSFINKTKIKLWPEQQNWQNQKINENSKFDIFWMKFEEQNRSCFFFFRATNPLLINVTLRTFAPYDISTRQHLFDKREHRWAVVVAQLVETSIPKPEIRGSKPFEAKFIFNIYCQLYWKYETK